MDAQEQLALSPFSWAQAGIQHRPNPSRSRRYLALWSVPDPLPSRTCRLPFAPSLSAWLDATETQTHWVLFGLAVPISGVALFEAISDNPTLTVSLGILGLALMLLGVAHVFGEDLELMLTTAGVVLVMVAHIRNLHIGHDHTRRLANTETNQPDSSEESIMKYDNILQTIGNTPVVKLNRIAPDHVDMYVKVESFNPMASVKDRLAYAIIKDARDSGALQPGQTVIEATSGNTGIALAMVCAVMGHPFVATMVETFSIERRKVMRALGAKVILTPAWARHWHGCPG